MTPLKDRKGLRRAGWALFLYVTVVSIAVPAAHAGDFTNFFRKKPPIATTQPPTDSAKAPARTLSSPTAPVAMTGVWAQLDAKGLAFLQKKETFVRTNLAGTPENLQKLVAAELALPTLQSSSKLKLGLAQNPLVSRVEADALKAFRLSLGKVKQRDLLAASVPVLLAVGNAKPGLRADILGALEQLSLGAFSLGDRHQILALITYRHFAGPDATKQFLEARFLPAHRVQPHFSEMTLAFKGALNQALLERKLIAEESRTKRSPAK
jgi:hypothetical protein